MSKAVYDTIKIGVGLDGINKDAHVCGKNIFKPELECIAVLVHYLGHSVSQEKLLMKMVGCDFHLDAIEKIQALDNLQYQEFLGYLGETLLNTTHESYVGQALLEDFKEHCTCCNG